MRTLPVLGLLLLVVAGCSEPPQKEIDQAQAAIDSARAAGADTYAADEYTAAASALQKAHTSVDQRDYRQALSYAIDAKQRAAAAARSTPEAKARARRVADALITSCSARISQLETRVRVAEATHLPEADLHSARETVTGAENRLQETRMLMAAGKYQDVVEGLTDVRRNLDAAMQALDAVALRPAHRKPGHSQFSRTGTLTVFAKG